ncbi:MAG: YcxB family protein, partial [Stomatobaculum sp.]|nr:YcxB family protein [Stomatobaculum sp.]
LTVAIGIIVLHPIILFVAAAYLIWVLIILGQEEIRIRSYVRSKDCLIGLKNTFFMEGNRIRIQIPDKNITANLTVNRLAVAFEISALFLLYTTAQQVYLVPKRAFTEDQLRKIRSTLAKQIPGRFSTRF